MSYTAWMMCIQLILKEANKSGFDMLRHPLLGLHWGGLCHVTDGEGTLLLEKEIIIKELILLHGLVLRYKVQGMALLNIQDGQEHLVLLL